MTNLTTSDKGNIAGRFATSGMSLHIALIAATCIAAALAGRLFMPASYVSPFWPAAGLALAAILMCGTRCWPGVWIGVFIANLLLDVSPTGAEVAGLLATGSTTQALVGALLTRHFLTLPQPLSREWDIWRFLLLAGPLSCIIAATAGTLVLSVFDRMTAVDMPAQWLLWWTGDTLGVLLFAPLTLLVWPGAGAIWPQGRNRVALPMLVAVILLAAGHWVFARLEESRAREATHHLMEEIYNNAFIALSVSIQPLHSIERFFVASDTVSRAGYATFNTAIINQPGILSVDWAPRVPDTQRASFEAVQRREMSGYRIFEPGSDGRPRPATVRAEYFPISYIAPLAGNTVVLGLDHGFEAPRREAMAHARDSGEVVTAAVISLLRTKREAILAYKPVYNAGFEAKDASVEARRAALRGFIVGAFDLEKLFAPLAREAAIHQIEFRITDVTPGNAAHLLAGNLAAGTIMEWRRKVIFTDRHWLLETKPVNGYGQLGASLQSRLYFGFSVVAAFLITFAVLSAAGRQAATAAVVVARTAELENELRARRAAEAALRESEQNIGITLRSIGDAVLATDANGCITRMNPIAEQLTGWPLAEALGRPIEDVFHILNEETRLPAVIPVAEVLRTGEIHGLANHSVLITRDGHEFHIADSAAPIRDTEGVAQGVVLIFRDVGTEREAERALQASETRYRQFIESSPLGVFVQCDGNFVFMNPKAVGMLGAESATQLLGRPVLESIHPDSRDAVRQCISRLNTNRETVSTLDEMWLRLDGSMFHGAATAVPYLYEEQPATLVMLQDITARKEAEAQLDRFFTLSLDMLCIFGADGYFKRLSPAFTQTLGWSVDEMLARPFIDFVHPDDIAATLREVEKQLVLGEPAPHFENRYLHKDGSWRILAWRSTPQPNGLMFATARDVTWQRAAEKQLEQARADAEYANRAKSAFLATMSHEIRTPMNGVIGMVEVLAQSRLSEHQTELVSTIRESAAALLNIIDDILDFSKIEASRLEIERMPISVADLVEGLCNSLIPVATAKGVTMTLFVSPDIPERVLSDDVRLRQILCNLIGNAIKFSSGQSRTGRVMIRVEKLDSAPLRLIFHIADNGIGMKPKTLDIIFNPFTQAEISTTRRFGGTGLGLAICKRLVDLMEGEITVTSTFGAGTVFTLVLPFEPAFDQPVRPQPDLSGIDCIVVENPELNVADLRVYLEHAGARVLAARDMTAAAQATTSLPGMVVIIQHTEPQTPARSVTLDTALPNVRHLLITQGQRRRARVETPELVTLDGDALRRQALLRAVAVAAGRASPEIGQDHNANDLAPDEMAPPPTVAEARAQGRLILIAEDDELNQHVILQQLRLLGYAGEVASNGEEALRLWREGNYALLLTDLHMPEMDGYALSRTIRREEREQRHIPILALTANALHGEANRARAFGMDEYLTKPVPLRLLRTTLEKWLPRLDNTSLTVASRTVPRFGERPLVDISVLVDLVGDNSETLHEFLSDYLISLRKLTKELDAAFSAGDVRHVSAVAHRLKSASRAVGALTLGDLCAGLESAGKAGDKITVGQEMQRFETALVVVEREIQYILHNGLGNIHGDDS